MGPKLGKYDMIRLLGHGAMGEVYLAHHPAIGREVAIKTILPAMGRTGDMEARFRREAAAAGTLNHPNIVTIYDFDRDGDVLYLVMEYLEGEDLEVLLRRKALTRTQLLEVLAQVCEGLSFAHARGVVHRDIKPTNVRVVKEGTRLRAKVMDFGIARMEGSEATSTGVVMGTVSYMAPEYIEGGQATALGDLWAVGVMLYEGLSGRRPFQGESPTTILYRIVHEVPSPLEGEAIQGLSPKTRAVLERLLSKDPAGRYASGEEAAKALRACMDPTWAGEEEDGTKQLPRIGTAPGAPSLLQPSPTPARSGRKLAALALASAGLALGAWLWLGPSSRGKVAWTSATGMAFVEVPSGSFLMGSPEGKGEPDERPQRRVSFSQPFYLGKYPVTVGEYRAFVEATGYRTEAEQGGGASVPLGGGLMNQQEDASWRNPYFAQTEQDPVVCLSWNDAVAFVAWLNATEGAERYRLPTEAEWEYACRAGSGGSFSFGEDGNSLFLHAWVESNAGGRTHPVGGKRPNPWGLHDMHGNVWEWCQDWYARDAYREGDALSPGGPRHGDARVQRGGAWTSPASLCRSAYRMKNAPDLRHADFGFRVLAVSRP